MSALLKPVPHHREPRTSQAEQGQGVLWEAPHQGEGGPRSEGRPHAVSLRLSCALLLRPHTTTRGTLLPAEVGFSPVSNSVTPAGCLHLNWILTPAPGERVHPQGRTRSHKAAPTQTPIESPGCHPCSRPMGCKSEVPSTLL